MKYITPAAHKRERLDVHKSHRQAHIEPISAPLYVITSIFNPSRYASRYRLYTGFEKHMEDSGARLYTIELALRDRHHEVTHIENPYHIQLRGEYELWYKECLGNVGLRYLPHDWEYVMFCDADFLFTRPDWVNEVKHLLQQYDAVQCFSNLTYLDASGRVHNQLDGFAYLHCNQDKMPKCYGHRGAVGGAWAFRRSALEKLGGLLEICILGSGDWHMAFALAERDDYHPEMKFEKIPRYVEAIEEWREKAKALRGNIGYMEGNAIHFWHGALKNRGYSTRWKILVDNHFDPYADLRHDWQGVLILNKNKPKMKSQIRDYFSARAEDQL